MSAQSPHLPDDPTKDWFIVSPLYRTITALSGQCLMKVPVYMDQPSPIHLHPPSSVTETPHVSIEVLGYHSLCPVYCPLAGLFFFVFFPVLMEVLSYFHVSV